MRKSLSMILLIACFALGAFADQAQSGAAAPAGVVNINTADASQLSMLPRVGVKAAQRILDYRAQHGTFKKATDLMQVKGFGDKTFQRLSPFIVLDGKTTLTAKVAGQRKPRSSGRSHQPTPATR
jgi:competence ComEA-like helix-hairpin-helix protein